MSDKPSVSEILGYLDGEISHHKKRLESSVNFGWVDKAEVCRSHLKILEAIRALILASDKGPGVKKEAVEKCVNRLHYWSREANKPSEEFIRNRIKDLLREAGMSVIPVKEKEKP